MKSLMQPMQLIKLLTLIAILSANLLTQQASALQMEPMSLILKPAGGGSKQSFTVANETNKPMAVKFSITTRQTINNKEVRRPASHEFLIYPAQTVIPPRTSQRIRVEWLGNQRLNKEKPYRLIAEQLPVDLGEKKKTGLTMLMKMEGSLYVQPSNTKSNIRVTRVQQHGNMLAVTVQNTGTRHQLLTRTRLSLKNGNQAINLNSQALKGLEGNNILAGETMRFIIKKPANFRNGNWASNLIFAK